MVSRTAGKIGLTTLAATVLAACGARASLVIGVATVGAGGAGGGGTGTGATGAAGSGTAGGTTGTGGQGPAAPCGTLTWVGEPKIVTLAQVGLQGGSCMRPRLVPIDQTQVGLVFEALTNMGGSIDLDSRAVEPWASWPPKLDQLGTIATENGLFSPIAIGPSTAKTYVWVMAGANGYLQRARAHPDGSSPGIFPQYPWWAPGDPKLVAPSTATVPSYLVGYGPPTTVSLDFCKNFDVVGPDKLGVFSCASPSAVAGAAGVDDHAFVVAATSQAPFDGCADPGPPGPPLVVQMARVDAFGWTPGSSVVEAGPVLDLQVVPRDGGAWVAYRVDGDPMLHVLAVDGAGKIVDTQQRAGKPTDSDAVVAWRDGFAHAIVRAGDGGAPGTVALEVWTGAGAMSIVDTSPKLLPVGRPAVIASGDGRSILVAVENAGNGPHAIGLLRADCLP